MLTSGRWTRDELPIALNVYHKLAFGQLHARQPAIVVLASKLGRGANSVAMKLCRNGICLSCLHDAAFDGHLISFDEKLRLVLSPRLRQALPHRAVAESFGAYEGEPLNLPEDAVAPDPAFLAKHRAGIAQ